jgi:hypothetical protein
VGAWPPVAPDWLAFPVLALTVVAALSILAIYDAGRVSSSMSAVRHRRKRYSSAQSTAI